MHRPAPGYGQSAACRCMTGSRAGQRQHSLLGEARVQAGHVTGIPRAHQRPTSLAAVVQIITYAAAVNSVDIKPNQIVSFNFVIWCDSLLNACCEPECRAC